MVRKNLAVDDVPNYIGADDKETDEEIQRGDSHGQGSFVGSFGRISGDDGGLDGHANAPNQRRRPP